MKILIILIFALFDSCSYESEKPNTILLTHVMAAPQLVDRGRVELLNVLIKDTSMILNAKGIVEINGSFTYKSLVNYENKEYESEIKEYLNTIKFIPAHYHKDNKTFRQEWIIPIKLQSKSK
jgi:hypothetical protein